MKRAHPPLRRVMRGNPQRVDPSLSISTASLISLTPSPTSSVSSGSPTSTSCSSSLTPSASSTAETWIKPQLMMAVSSPLPTTATVPGCWNSNTGLDHQQQQLENDSCYSSCSEESHISLSRESSDGLSKQLYQMNLDEGDIADQAAQKGIPAELLAFAHNLGFTEDQLMTVLRKVGADAGQDRILSELVTVGQATSETIARPPLRQTRSNGSQPAPTSTANPINTVPNTSSTTTSTNQLRSIVIDGSNIAMSHGRKEVFSCAGIRDCVQFFVDRGHNDILVFIPQFRREAARAHSPITDQHVLSELDRQKRICWTPSRRVNGRRIVCHDDRYILKIAEEKDAVVVSNDEYRDLVRENPQYGKLVETRLLMYSFVDGKFVPPDDPLGRHGPTLNQFLSKNSSNSNTLLCPYARKCTYGNKCKYFHPERPNGVHVSVTDRLMRDKNQKKPVTSGRSFGQIDTLKPLHSPVVRTQSLNMRLEAGINQDNTITNDTVPISSYPQPWHAAVGRNQSMPIPFRYNKEAQDNSYQLQYNLYAPSTAVWGHSELSVGPLNTNNSSDTQKIKEQERSRLHYNLCQIFPETVVVNVMAAYPEETRSQVLCEHILTMNKRFSDN